MSEAVKVEFLYCFNLTSLSVEVSHDVTSGTHFLPRGKLRRLTLIFSHCNHISHWLTTLQFASSGHHYCCIPLTLFKKTLVRDDQLVRPPTHSLTYNICPTPLLE